MSKEEIRKATIKEIAECKALSLGTSSEFAIRLEHSGVFPRYSFGMILGIREEHERLLAELREKIDSRIKFLQTREDMRGGTIWSQAVSELESFREEYLSEKKEVKAE